MTVAGAIALQKNQGGDLPDVKITDAHDGLELVKPHTSIPSPNSSRSASDDQDMTVALF
jgi:hypothetical protein